MERMKADKPTVMQRQVDLLNARYDLSDRPAEGVTMFRGKQVQQGVRVKLPQGVLATSLKRQAERSLNCFGNKIAAFVVYESVGAVREGENDCSSKTNRLLSARQFCRISMRPTIWRDGSRVTIRTPKMWSRRRPFVLSNIGKGSLEAIAGHGCLPLFETLIIRGSGNGPSNRN